MGERLHGGAAIQIRGRIASKAASAVEPVGLLVGPGASVDWLGQSLALSVSVSDGVVEVAPRAAVWPVDEPGSSAIASSWEWDAVALGVRVGLIAPTAVTILSLEYAVLDSERLSRSEEDDDKCA